MAEVAATVPLPLRERIAALLLIRPGESRRTALLFVQLLLASAIFILGRTVRDTLFLSRYSVDALPWMFVLYGLASAITVVVYGRFADRMARHRVIVASAVIGGSSYLAVWILVRLEVSLAYPVFYVWSEVFANLLIVQFWTLANDLHDARSAKRLFPTIGAARVLGVIVIGMSAGLLVRTIGTAQLLFVLVAMIAAVALIAVALRQEPRPGAPGHVSRSRFRRNKPIVAHRYVQVFALMIFLAFTALTVGDYQFKVIARATYREDELARFFSLFYAATGIIALSFQLIVTPRLLRRFGVSAGMSVMPAVFGLASGVLLFVPHLAIATLMKFADNGFQYSIHETTLQSLYVPFADATKARTRAFLDAVVKPCSYGAGGLVLVGLAPHVEVQSLCWVTVGLVTLWLLQIPVVKRRYARSLQETLSARGGLALDESGIVLDQAARQALFGALRSGDRGQILLALHSLTEHDLAPTSALLRELAGHPDRHVREATLLRLPDLGAPPRELLKHALRDEDASVRATAAMSYARVAGDDAIDDLEECLADEAKKVRVSALAGILIHGGVEGLIRGGAILDTMLKGKPKSRAEAAKTLGRLGPSAYRPLVRLLNDPKKKVRRAALAACAGVADPRLVPVLVPRLAEPAYQREAQAALIAIGPAAVQTLLDHLDDHDTPRVTRLAIPRILQYVRTPETYRALLERASVEDSLVRTRILAVLSRLRARLGLPVEPLDDIMDRVRAEIGDGCRVQGAAQVLDQAVGTTLLREEAEVRFRRSVERILRVLELRYERQPLRLARHTMFHPTRRANALEVLDTALDPELRSLVMGYVDAPDMTTRLRTMGSLAPPAKELESLLARACGHPNPYVVATTLHAMAQHRHALGAELAREALGHPSALVREVALWSLATLEGERARASLEASIDDEDPIVARHATRTLARFGDGRLEEESMKSTIDKILFLRSVTFFEDVSGEDLAPLARVADEITVAEGERIFAKGDQGDDLFIVVTGRVAIRLGEEDVATLGPTEAFGEMSVLDESPRSAAAVATEETTLLRIGSEEFYEIIHEQSEIAEAVIRMLTRRLRDALGSHARTAETVPPPSRVG